MGNYGVIMSFFKVDGDLLEAPNSVFGADYLLLADHKDDYTLPVEGWYWFDSEDEARVFFNLPKVIE